LTQIVEIPLDLIVSEQHPRKKFDPVQLQELADSIQECGLLSPITVFRNEDGNTFTLLVGERRLRAHKLLNAPTIKAIICAKPSDVQKSSCRLVENTNRVDIGDFELAVALKERADKGESHETIAKSLGKSRSWVSHHLDVFRLPKSELEKLRTGEITYTQARMELARESQSTCGLTPEMQHGYGVHG
jgi:ParB family chromosome partitioning protein